MATKNTKTKSLEASLWEAADKLRGNLEAAEYKHVVLGLVFLKYVTDAFGTRRKELERLVSDPNSTEYIKNEGRRAKILESRDEYSAENIFWVPPPARWEFLISNAKQANIGVLIDKAMDAIEKENPKLRGVLPKTYARAEIDKRKLGELVDMLGNIGFTSVDHGTDDVLGRVYEYFLGRFASAEGRGAGEFYTPRSVVKLLVEMLEPFKGRVYDPCCGSGGMFVQSADFVKAHGGQRNDISIYGQEFVATTWRLCKMNLALRGVEANLSDGSADTFSNDRHPDLRANFILANPPFNVSDWGGEHLKDDQRWRYGTPPPTNANFAWVEHMIHHLAPSGTAGFVLANGSMTTNQSGEGEIRRKIIEADLVDCMVALPGQLFYTTQIPVCLWFLAKNKKNGGKRDRRGEVLFIDGRKLGTMIGRAQKELTDEDIQKVSNTYHAWRGEPKAGEYSDMPGFCKSATLNEISNHEHVLTPGRYVGAEDVEEDGEAFDQKMKRLVSLFHDQQVEAKKLDAKIEISLRELGYE
ncbi:MAG: SAM-dependent DNA methyltransferase [Acidimicrobiales bacterium]|nr:SAM-dependent DNA methyltransferase [Acidimicrobiales bacterium]